MRAAHRFLALALTLGAVTAPAIAQDAIVPDDYNFIRRAVALATDTDGDGTIEIFVRAGHYVDNVLIRRPNLSLTGEGAALTTIEGTGIVDTVRIRAENAVVEGFTIVAGGLLDSMDIRRAGSALVQNNVLTGGENGIRLRGAGAQFLDNEVFGTTQEGIKAEAAQSLMVLGNFVHDNVGEGIDFLRVRRSRAQGNLVSGNGGNGLRVRNSSQTRLIENQSTDNGNNGILLRGTTGMVLDSNTASGNVASGLRMRDTTATLVTLNSFTDNQEWGVRRRDWVDDDFDAAAAGVQDPPGDNDLSGNGFGELEED